MIDLRDGPDGSQDKLTWKWSKGTATVFDDFGDPVTGGTSYRVCLYDEIGGVATLKLGAEAPGGGTCANGRPCWRTTGPDADPRGYRYVDSDRTPNGVGSLTLRRGDEGKPRIALSAKGAALPIPAPFSPSQLFNQDTRVIVQLVRSDSGLCWETVHTAPATENSGSRFRSRF